MNRLVTYNNILNTTEKGLCDTMVAHLAYNRDVLGLIPGQKGKIWVIFLIPLCPYSVV